jgi:hypothetical protein
MFVGFVTDGMNKHLLSDFKIKLMKKIIYKPWMEQNIFIFIFNLIIIQLDFSQTIKKIHHNKNPLWFLIEILIIFLLLIKKFKFLLSKYNRIIKQISKKQVLNLKMR